MNEAVPVEKMRAPKGTYDILPQDAAVWRGLEANVHRIFREYGYGELRTPVFEHTELFQRGIGATTDIVEKEMFTFTDRGERSLTLRPEGTASIVRAYIEHNLAAAGGVAKLYYYGPMFRCEAPQAGRFRQFIQFGAEAIGSGEPQVDAEIIALAYNFYQRLGIRDLEIHLNSIGCPECRPAYRELLITHLQPRAEKLCPNCRRRLERNPLRLLDCKNSSCQELTADVPLITATLCPDCGSHFETLRRLLDSAGIGFQINPRLVRGFDYYTKTVFEVLAGDLGAQNALCGGGRYDGLVAECGGPPTPGIGFAAGMERLLMVLEKRGLLPQLNEKPDIFIAILGVEAQQAIFPIVQRLREAGLLVATDLQGRSLKAQLKLADKLAAPLTAIIGDDEIKKGSIMIRNMLSSQQLEIPLAKLKEFCLEQKQIR
jgi:histidyl-tRNA synthetase